MKALAWQNGIYDWGGIEIEINNLIFSLQTICRNFVSGLPARPACHTSILSLLRERVGERRRRWLCFHRLCLFLMRWRRSSISSHLISCAVTLCYIIPRDYAGVKGRQDQEAKNVRKSGNIKKWYTSCSSLAYCQEILISCRAQVAAAWDLNGW